MRAMPANDLNRGLGGLVLFGVDATEFSSRFLTSRLLSRARSMGEGGLELPGVEMGDP